MWIGPCRTAPPPSPPSNPPGVDARLTDPEEADPGAAAAAAGPGVLESWSPGLSPLLHVRPDREPREEKTHPEQVRIVRVSFLFSAGAADKTSRQPARSARAV